MGGCCEKDLRAVHPLSFVVLEVIGEDVFAFHTTPRLPLAFIFSFSREVEGSSPVESRREAG